MKQKLLLIFILTFITILIFSAYLAINALNKAKSASLDTGNTILINQAKEYYKNYTNSQKDTLELLIKTIEEDVKNLNDFTTRLFENDNIINTKEYWDYKEHLKHLPNNQLIEINTDKSTLWSPRWMDVNDKVLKKIEISAYLNEYFEPLLNRNENTVANYFLGSEGFLRYYPRVNMLDLFPPDLRTSEEIFYYPVTPRNNPTKKLKWTPLYKDPAGLGLMISAVAPVYSKNEFIGVVGTDMTLDKLVEHYIKEDNSKNRYAILLDKKFRPIALPKEAMKDFYKKELKEDDEIISHSLLEYDSEFKVTFNKIRNEDYGFEKIELKDRNLYISYVRLDKLNWIYANILSEEELLSVTKTLNSKIDVIIDDLIKSFAIPIIVFFILLVFTILFVINKFLKPIIQLSDATKAIADGDMTKNINIYAKDEVKVLVDNFKTMQKSIQEHEKELKEFNQELQEKVYERTEELEESNEELQAMIHNLKHTQEKLIESEKMASLGSLVAGVAHEINTPVGIGLTGITHFIETLKKIRDDFDKEEMTENQFREFIETSEELSHLINSNLNKTAHLVKSFKQIAVDQTHEEKREINLNKYIEDTVFSLGNITKNSKITIDIICKNDIILNTYPGLLSQVITNLIINSFRHGFEENKKGSIKIEISKEEHYYKIIYTDNGKGIEKKNLSKIFDPFFTTNRKKGGTGLGLNIIYNIITSKLNGTITCKSEENQGVEFTITLKKDSQVEDIKEFTWQI